MKNSSRIFGSILSLPSLIKLIMVNALCLIGFGAALQAQTPPELPKINLEMSAPDSTGQKQLYLCFHAVAGVNYTLEMANQEDGLAYDSWFQTGALVYGLGVDVRLPIYTFHPPDPTTNQPVDEYFLAPTEVITMMISPLSNGQGVAVSWSDAYGSFGARHVYATTNSLASVPFAGTWRSTDVDMIWSKMGEVDTSDPSSLNSTLSWFQQYQWEQIQAAMPDILTGTGGAMQLSLSGAPTQGANTVKGRFFRLRPSYPDSDGDGIPDWMEFAGYTSGGVHYSSNPFATDSDGDGTTDAEEWAAGTNPNDASSKPLKVIASAPFPDEAGHPRDRAVVLYLNQALPDSVTSIPSSILEHITWQPGLYPDVESYDVPAYTAVTGTTMILPGRKAIAFLPNPVFVAGSNHTTHNNYRVTFNGSNTGLAHVVPYQAEFATVDTYDETGPWVKRVRPGEDYINVTTDFSPIIDWSQPLLPSTVIPANITLINSDTGIPATVTMAFDYDTNRMTLTHASALAPDANYTVTLGTGFTNLMGKPLLSAFVWKFHTRPNAAAIVAGQGPYVQSVTPAAYSKNVSVTPTFTLMFSGQIDSTTLSTTTIRLVEITSGSELPLSFAFDSSTHTLTLQPIYSLAPNTDYWLDFGGGVNSGGTTPQSLQGPSSSLFKTGDPNTSQPESGGDNTNTDEGDEDPTQPGSLTLHLAYGDPDEDSGATVKVKITLPDGTSRDQEMPNATNTYLQKDTAEIPAGSTVEVIPTFLKGNDPNYLEEFPEVQLEMSVAKFPKKICALVFHKNKNVPSPVYDSLLREDSSFTARVEDNESILLAPVILEVSGSRAPERKKWVPSGVQASQLQFPDVISGQGATYGNYLWDNDQVKARKPSEANHKAIAAALTILRKDVTEYGAPNSVPDFAIHFKLGGELSGISWVPVATTRTMGSGVEVTPPNLTNSNTGDAVLSATNATKGGLFRYQLEIDSAKIGVQVWLPMAGPDIAEFWQGRVDYYRNTWGPAYQYQLNFNPYVIAAAPATILAAKQFVSVTRLFSIGPNLDWEEESQPIRGSQYPLKSPAGLANKEGTRQGTDHAGDKDRLTMNGIVTDFAKRNDMMYAVIGRSMGLSETLIQAGPFLVQQLDTIFGGVGTTDGSTTLEAYNAGFELYNGSALSSVIHSHGYSMMEPEGGAVYEWPSTDTTTIKLNAPNGSAESTLDDWAGITQ